MKKFFFATAMMAASIAGQAQLVPAPSPMARTMQMVGLTEVEIEYSRPALNGREILTAQFVPSGELWRTGANMASKITFSNDVSIDGKEVKAGSYAIFTIPTAESVEFILNSNANQGGTGSYDESLNVVKTSVKMQKTGESVERMRFSIENMTDESAHITWAWGNHSFAVPVKVATVELAKANIDKRLKEFEGQYSFYNEAARYYLDANVDNAKALEWAKKSTEMSEKFWNVHTLARAYHANGDKANATKTAERSLALSKEADYGPYIVMNENLLAEIKGKKK